MKRMLISQQELDEIHSMLEKLRERIAEIRFRAVTIERRVAPSEDERRAAAAERKRQSRARGNP